jgi:hypothetical protein
MMQALPESVFDRVLSPVTDCLTPDAARRILESKLDPAIQRRLDELAPKANFGTLSQAERDEYEELIDAVELLAVFKAKSRLILRQQGAA